MLPGTMILGAWVNTGSFADQRFNTQGALLAIAGGAPLQHQGNDAIYGVVDQMLWRVPGPGDGSLNFFMRAMAAPGDRNLIDVYADGGFTFKGLIGRRANDTTGLGFAVGRVSPAGAAFDRDLAAALGQAIPVADFEAVIELTYQWKLADKWFVQPDLQYIFHPGGNIANPLDPTGRSAIPNALVLGTRMVMRF
jgi:porin